MDQAHKVRQTQSRHQPTSLIMFKLVALFAVLAVASAAPGYLGAPAVATYAAPAYAAPVAYSAYAAPAVVKAAPVAYAAPAYAAAPVAYGAYAAPAVAYAGAPVVKTAYLG